MIPLRFLAASAALTPALILAVPAGAQLLDPLYADGAVLQRGAPMLVSGTARAGETVTVTLDGRSARATAGEDGRWAARLPTHAAGGPFTLEARSGSQRAVARDVLVGDVWLCSGQSNMEYATERALDAWNVLNNAADPQLRLLTVQKDAALAPRARFAKPVAWIAATKESVAPFSAACYFMGRELRATQKVPTGLINASWGGTAIDTWRSQDAVARAGAAEPIAILRQFRSDPAGANRRWGAVWQQWYQSRAGADAAPWSDDASGWRRVPALTNWESWGVPALADYNGVVFYRTEVTLTPEQARQAATLSVGWVDEIDQSWVNGVAVGNSYGPSEDRAYTLAPSVLRAGRNTITIAAIDTYGQGGLVGPEALRKLRFADGTEVPLAGTWRYLPAPEGTGQPPRAPWEPIAGISGLYNAMIAPLGRFGLAGIAWYQGESDAGAAPGYAAKLTSLMQDWRTQFGRPQLPFLVAQLAGWGAPPIAPVDSGFARVRDEQRRAVAADPNAGLAVTIDLGDRKDIHPANKLDVGLRLARAAKALVYGGSEPRMGPTIASASRTPAGVILRFTGVTGTLAAISAAQPIAFEACTGGTCRFSAAQLVDGAVLLSDAAADRVRYCWGDSPVCNLVDGAGLPLGPFEVEVPH